MRSLARTQFGAIFQTEVLLNSKRVAPYVMLILFGFNAWLWTVKGAAVHYGWAMNSDYFILRNFLGFSFLTLPLFTALIMGDPVSRDFRTGIAPLIFSKPVSRATYLFGKFSSNFFVLVCCQAAFVLTMLILQAFPTSQMIVQPARVLPYFKHFLFFVVISHMVLAAIHFTVGTLTRNPKLVYGLAVSFYPFYIAYQLFVLKGLPARWRGVLDPLLMNWAGDPAKGRNGELLNAELIDQLAYSYDANMLANRALMLLSAGMCLTILYVRFSLVKGKDKSQVTTINLAPSAEWLDAGAESFRVAQPVQVEADAPRERVAIPKVGTARGGVRANLKQFLAALGVELRLLSAERSLVVILPIATLLCVVGMAYYEAVPEGLYTARYATRTAESLLLFLVAIAVFFTGEAMHRDRELRVEPVFLIPNMVFLIAAATALNVLLRDKYLTYAVSFAIGLGLFYLFNQGYNHWLYNFVLYNLWTPSDLTGIASNLSQIITHRIYSLAMATIFLTLAHLFFERKSTKGLQSQRRLSGTG